MKKLTYLFILFFSLLNVNSFSKENILCFSIAKLTDYAISF